MSATAPAKPARIDYEGLGNLYERIGPFQFCKAIKTMVSEGKVRPDDFSFARLAGAVGLFESKFWTHSTPEGVLVESFARSRNQPEREIGLPLRESEEFSEANPGVSSHVFQTITNELISAAMIDGYESAAGMIGDRLVTVQKATWRNQKITGITALGGPSEVPEGHAYKETDFDEKWVTTKETKKGVILSLTEELVAFDQTGEIMSRARSLGEYVRQEREITIIEGVTDANNNVYRPSGTAEALYNADGSNYNWIGSGNTTSTSFNAATALEDWTDLDHVRRYRATEIKDDRIDGTQRPIGMLNMAAPLLVPESLVGVATYIATATEVEKRTGSSANIARFANPVSGMISEVLHSPYLDAQSIYDWYYGQFSKQFVWTEIWPFQTFMQGRDSETAFTNDCVARFKARYYGGISAKDSVYVTKIDGN